MNELLVYLGSFTLAGQLSPELTDHLISVLKYKELPKDSFLLKAGQISSEICFVAGGLLWCYYEDEKGQEISSWFMKEGDVIFSVESFFEQVPGEEFIKAIEETAVLYITRKELDFIYENFPEFERVGRLVLEKYYKQWNVFLKSFKLHSAEGRYEYLVKVNPEIILRVPNKDVASFLGMHPVTLSKIRNQSQK